MRLTWRRSKWKELQQIPVGGLLVSPHSTAEVLCSSRKYRQRLGVQLNCLEVEISEEVAGVLIRVQEGRAADEAWSLGSTS